jgi:hypothetical protein
MCDVSIGNIRIKQSIKNSTSDTIIIVNSVKQFRGVNIDTIICYPFSETIFINTLLKKQPLEPYDSPFIYEGCIVKLSSGRTLKKDIYNTANWQYYDEKNQEWLRFCITVEDLE